MSLATERGSGLIDLLVARRFVGATDRKVRTHLLELELVGVGVELDEVYSVLGVTSVRRGVESKALVGVVPRSSGLHRLVDIPAVGLLLRILPYDVLGVTGIAYPSYSWYGYRQHHRHHRR